jgi:hypothetical protein
MRQTGWISVRVEDVAITSQARPTMAWSRMTWQADGR